MLRKIKHFIKSKLLSAIPAPISTGVVNAPSPELPVKKARKPAVKKAVKKTAEKKPTVPKATTRPKKAK